MALTNLHHDRLFSPRLPVYTSPSPVMTTSPLLLPPEHKSGFDSQFHHEIINLRERRAQLSEKLAQAKQSPPTPALRKEIMEEYSSLESAKKWLALMADAVEKSRQAMAANMR